jgi:hypothetical protein
VLDAVIACGKGSWSLGGSFVEEVDSAVGSTVTVVAGGSVVLSNSGGAGAVGNLRRTFLAGGTQGIIFQSLNVDFIMKIHEKAQTKKEQETRSL